MKKIYREMMIFIFVYPEKELNELLSESQGVMGAITESDIKHLVIETDIPMEYLTILRREINRLLPNPVSIADFPGVEVSIIKKMTGKNIKNTVRFLVQCSV